MESEVSRKIFEAVKLDDVKTFSNLVQSNADLKIRYGRFPLLSVCYLYESYNILSKFEVAMLSGSNFEVFGEYVEIYQKFKKYAKKSLRLYTFDDAIVWPIEMLAILDKRELLVQNFKKMQRTEKNIQNIKKIYILNKNLDVEVSTSAIKIKASKLNLKQRLIAVCMSILLALFMVLPVGSILAVKLSSGLGIDSNPIVVKTEKEFLTALGGKLNYVLGADIELSKDVEPQNFAGTLDGNGHLVKANGKLPNGLFGKLSGTIKNLKLEVELNNDSLQTDYAVFANTISGKVENCEIVGDANATFLLENVNEEDDTYFSIFANFNSGVILNCTANVFAHIINVSERNAYLSGFVGENSGLIENCKNIATKFETDTADICGIAVSNTGEIRACENHAEIIQTSEKQWHPNCSGIAISNEGKINDCKNFAKITSTSLIESLSNGGVLNVFSSGIVVQNFGEVSACENTGDIVGNAQIAVVYSAGVVCQNIRSDNKSGSIISSKAKCKILANSKSADVYASGVATQSAGTIKACEFDGNIEMDSSKNIFGAGICSYSYYGRIDDCLSNVTFAESVEGSQQNTFKVAVVIFMWDSIENPFLGTVILGNAKEYSSNNKYVSGSTFSYSACQWAKQNNIWIWANWLDDSVCGCSQVENISNLSLGDGL